MPCRGEWKDVTRAHCHFRYECTAESVTYVNCRCRDCQRASLCRGCSRRRNCRSKYFRCDAFSEMHEVSVKCQELIAPRELIAMLHAALASAIGSRAAGGKHIKTVPSAIAMA